MHRLLILVLVAAPLLALAQGPGDRGSWLERLLERQVPGLAIEGLSGTWRAAPAATRITLSDAAGPWLVAESVRLELAPFALLRGEALVRALTAARLRIERLPTPAGTDPSAAPDAGVLPELPSLPVEVALDRLAIDRLELAPGVAGVEAAFSLTGAARLAAGLTATLALDRLDGVGGTARLALALLPAEDRLTATLDLTEPPGGIVAGLLGQPDRPLTVALSLAGPASGAALRLAAELGPELALTAAGEVSADPQGGVAARITGQARAAPLLPAPVGPLATPVEFALDAGLDAARRLTLRAASASLPAGRVAIAGDAALGTRTGAVALTIEAAVASSAGFAALLPPGLGWDSVAATGRVGGTIATPEIALTLAPAGLVTGVAAADAALGADPTLDVTASLPGPRVDARLAGAGFAARLEGRLDPLMAELRATVADLAAVGIAGGITLAATATGDLADPSLTLNVTAPSLTAGGVTLAGLRLDAAIATPRSAPQARIDAAGVVADLPLEVTLRGAPEGTALRLETATARFGPARATAEGLFEPATGLFTGPVRVEASDLAPLAPLLGQPIAGRARLDVRLAPQGGAQGFAITLDAPSVVLAGGAARLGARATGTPAAFDWSLDAAGAGGSGRARGRVERAGAATRLDLATLDLAAAGETLRLAAPARFALGADGGIEVASLALVPGRGGRITAAGRWGPREADLTVTVRAVPAALATPFAPDILPAGTLTGEARITGPVASPAIQASLRGEGLRSGAEWARALPPLGVRAEASRTGTLVTARAELDAGAGGRLVATARLPQGFDGGLEARVDGGLNLAPLVAPFLVGASDRVGGRLDLALRAEGSVASPRLGGRATLSGGSWRNPALGTRFDGIEAVVTGAGDQLRIERATARTVGGGTLSLSGTLSPLAPGLPADLRLVARDARPIVSPYGSAIMGADLRIAGPLTGGALLAGDVRITRAELVVPDTLPRAVPVLEPVGIRGTAPCRGPRPAACAGVRVVEAAPAGPPALPIALAVRVTAPRAIFVRGRGLDAELGGDVRIGGTLAAPLIEGGFTLRRGTLEILARRLTFKQGRIDFADGSLVPLLDFVATAPTRGAEVTVTVRGRPSAPEITFGSVPEMPPDEALSRLLFDRDTGRLSPFEIAQLAQTLAQLTGTGSGFDPLGDLRGALGLDRLGVAGGEGGAALEAGRYVAPGVFLGLKQGLEGGQTGVGVEVELTPRVKVEAQTGTGAAGNRVGIAAEWEY